MSESVTVCSDLLPMVTGRGSWVIGSEFGKLLGSCSDMMDKRDFEFVKESSTSLTFYEFGIIFSGPELVDFSELIDFSFRFLTSQVLFC